MTSIVSLESNGLSAFRDACAELNVPIPKLIERCCLWVAPETFRALPVWYPEAFRGAPICDSSWSRRYTNTRRSTGETADKSEPNIRANWALWQALGFKRRKKPKNWTACHIWGVDDPQFQQTNVIVQDPRFYTCVANMVALPTPLKAFTDSLPEIKLMLRVCAYHLYGWVCEHEAVAHDAALVKAGHIPPGYPETWPRQQGGPPPPGVIGLSDVIASLVSRRKREIGRELENAGPLYPREKVVIPTLQFWKINVGT